MAIRRIYTGNSLCLYKKAKPVTAFDERLAELIDDMAQTMYDADGLGLAAPQIGILRRVVVIDCSEGRNELIEAVNPGVVYVAGEQGGLEGCLSFPNESGYVVRPNIAVMRAQDRNGVEFEIRAEGLLARAILHECDHLDGKVYKRLVIPTPDSYDPEADLQ